LGALVTTLNHARINLSLANATPVAGLGTAPSHNHIFLPVLEKEKRTVE